MNIIIAPYSNRLASGKTNAKNFPHWAELVRILKAAGDYILQIGGPGEQRIDGVDTTALGANFKDVEKLVQNCHTWAAVDNFLPHLGWALGKPGVAIFAQSDPEIFGHKENINLLKSRKFLRPNQYGTWDEAAYNPSHFVTAAEVAAALQKFRSPQ